MRPQKVLVKNFLLVHTCGHVEAEKIWRTPMLEKEIEARLVRKVKELGGIAYKFVSPAHRGVADRIVVLPHGNVVFVELKTATGKLSPLQEVFARDMERLGQNYIVLKSREEVDAFIRAAPAGHHRRA